MTPSFLPSFLLLRPHLLEVRGSPKSGVPLSDQEQAHKGRVSLHLTAWNCGSMNSGHFLAFFTKMAFSVECLSRGSPWLYHFMILKGEENNNKKDQVTNTYNLHLYHVTLLLCKADDGLFFPVRILKGRSFISHPHIFFNAQTLLPFFFVSFFIVSVGFVSCHIRHHYVIRHQASPGLAPPCCWWGQSSGRLEPGTGGTCSPTGPPAPACSWGWGAPGRPRPPPPPACHPPAPSACSPAPSLTLTIAPTQVTQSVHCTTGAFSSQHIISCWLKPCNSIGGGEVGEKIFALSKTQLHHLVSKKWMCRIFFNILLCFSRNLKFWVTRIWSVTDDTPSDLSMFQLLWNEEKNLPINHPLMYLGTLSSGS